jgi:phosphoribosylanthranilate isomerase
MAEVKICGLSTPETMQAALDQGADMVGLVFFAKSPRNVSVAQAKILADQARGKAAIVALVVDADDAQLQTIVAELHPDFFQAHGSETPERIAEIHALTATPIIKAIKVETASDVASAKAYEAAVLILYDAKAPKGSLPGGNGLSFDWTLMDGVTPPYMLSGGLDADNVAQAITLTRAPIVDVSSGVESSPGVKDAQLIAKFIKAAKSAGNEDSL